MLKTIALFSVAIVSSAQANKMINWADERMDNDFVLPW